MTRHAAKQHRIARLLREIRAGKHSGASNEALSWEADVHLSTVRQIRRTAKQTATP